MPYKNDAVLQYLMAATRDVLLPTEFRLAAATMALLAERGAGNP